MGTDLRLKWKFVIFSEEKKKLEAKFELDFKLAIFLKNFGLWSFD